MTRLHILLTVMVVMVAALFAGHEALAKVLTGTGGEDTLLGTDGDDRLDGRGGDDEVDAGAGNDLIYARDTDGVDYIDCGGGFDKVETIHRDDRTKSNCERSLGPRQGDI
jgi:Ca2+-binding RTX toxin-like protein